MTTTHRILLALALVALSACTSSETTREDHAADKTPGNTQSSDGLPSGNVAAGKELAQACMACHGPDGNAPIDPSYPRIGGQYRDYLEIALQHYRDGTRSNPIMGSQAQPLTDQQIADLAAYFASLKGDLTDLHTLR